MNINRLVLIVSLLAASPIYAASMVMVQFGSFETQAEASKRLSDVKSANSAALGGLTTTVREVKLPPDNLTVYRTQAGPLESRAAAQSLCSKLASNGSECYVVETAVSQAVPPVSKMAEAVAAPVKAASATANDTVKQVSASATAAANAPATPLRDPRNMAALGTVTPPATSIKIPEVARNALPAGDTLKPAVASPELKSAMDRAVSAQDSGNLSAAVPAVSVATVAPQRSFWSRVNPFTSDTPKASAVTKPTLLAEKKPEAAPVTEVDTNALPDVKMPSATLAAPELVALNTKDSDKNEPVISSTAPAAEIKLPMLVSAPVITNSPETRPRLLPPPAPLTQRDKTYLQELPAKSSPEILAAPIGATTLTSAPAPLKSLTAMDGTVKVEEAKRVPVTEIMTPPPVFSTTPVVTAAPTISLLPSSTVGTKTLWAQIGQFTDSDTALAFWDSYRQSHPDFPAVRVRVVSSLQQQQHGNDRVSLRVGPFAREGFINSLCASVSDSAKRCGVITDLGVAARATSTPGYLQGSRYKR